MPESEQGTGRDRRLGNRERADRASLFCLYAADNGRTGVASFSWPDVLSDPNNNPGPRIQDAGVKTGVNLNAFSSTFLGHMGNSGRNQFYGPNYTNADAVLMKNVQVTERFRMQIRSEFFNLFNHPQFRQPGNVIENPGTFGLSLEPLPGRMEPLPHGRSSWP